MIKFEHNKKLFFVILFLVVLFIIILYVFLEKERYYENPKENSCEIDSDCVKASCCHATSCVNKKHAPECSAVYCTLDCSGPLDCGRGVCGCVNNECNIITKE